MPRKRRTTRRKRSRRTGGLTFSMPRCNFTHPKVTGYVCNYCGSGKNKSSGTFIPVNLAVLANKKTSGMYNYASNRGWGSKARCSLGRMRVFR